MKEEILQKKIVDLVKQQNFLDAINNLEQLDEALRKSTDSATMPNFSVDSLLKEKYSISAKRVINALDNYELISGDVIKNISLDKSDRLYPDLILFNPYKCQVILIENKTDRKTEREAITELFGYSNEIRNHLPFLSNFDINYILISTEFNTLLDHSISGQLLSTDINLLCLKPVIANDEVIGLDLQFPVGWSDVGQTDIPDEALVSYSLCLFEKADIEDDFDFVSVVKMAADIMRNDASSFNTSGFYLIWQNAHGASKNHCKMGITIYTLNPFSFLSEAYKLGFPLNDNSALSKYLNEYTVERGTLQYPTSIFGIAENARTLLNKYFRTEWDTASTWQKDTGNSMHFVQRKIVQWDSWGEVGNYVRSFYLHPATRKQLFNDWPLDRGGGYQNPYIGLQIINHFAGNKVFRYGEFSHKEIFLFGLQLGFYRYACYNAVNQMDKNLPMTDALLFWTGLQLTQSLKEVQARINDSTIRKPPLFPMIIEKDRIYEDYWERMQKFISWFKEEFIGSKQYPTLALIFEQSINCYSYFDFYFKGTLNKEEIDLIEADFATIVRVKVLEIATDRKKDSNNNINIIKHLNEYYFENLLLQMSSEEIKLKLDSIDNKILCERFYDDFLGLLDLIRSALPHQLNPLKLARSVDWKAFKKTFDNFYDAGNRKVAIQISPNGVVGLVISDVPLTLNNREEVLIQFFPRSPTQLVAKKVKWDDLITGEIEL